MARPSPSTYPCCRNSLKSGAHAASGNGTSTAIRRAGWLCYACAATGHAVAPPRSPMTSRRLMRSALEGGPILHVPFRVCNSDTSHITAIFLALPVPQLKGQWFLYSLNSAPAGRLWTTGVCCPHAATGHVAAAPHLQQNLASSLNHLSFLNVPHPQE